MRGLGVQGWEFSSQAVSGCLCEWIFAGSGLDEQGNDALVNRAFFYGAKLSLARSLLNVLYFKSRIRKKKVQI